MGRTQNRGAADPLADDLRWYFCHSESELGVQSSFGAFVDMAMSGIQSGGRSNGAERRAAAIASRLDRPAQRHREMRRRVQALGAIDPIHVRVLHAAYGATNWTRMADDVFGRGTGERLARALGADRIGVALLTERLARAQREATPTPGASSSGPTMVVVDAQILEDDDALRARSVDAAGGEDSEAGRELLSLHGEELEEKAAELRIRRRRRSERRILPTGKAVREAPAPPLGALLRALVVAAYPQRLPKTAAQKAAMSEAMRQVNAIRDEATVLLQRARAAMPPAEERRPRAALPTGPRRGTQEVQVPPGLRPRSRPRQIFPDPADLLIGPGGL